MNKTLIVSGILAIVSSILYILYRPTNQKEQTFLINSVFIYILLFIILQPLLLNIKSENIVKDLNVFTILLLYIAWFTGSSLLIYYLTPIQAITRNTNTTMSNRSVE